MTITRMWHVPVAEEEPPTDISIPNDRADMVDKILSLALQLGLLKSQIRIEECVHELDTYDDGYE